MEKSKTSRDQKIELYNKLVASHADAIRKGATIPYTSLNGHMYSYFTKDDFAALRLPEDERIKFLDKYKTTLVEQYGIIQKEYVMIPGDLLKKTNELKQYFDISYKYVSSLKPKATTNNKKKK
jgi:hypothetical protein